MSRKLTAALPRNGRAAFQTLSVAARVWVNWCAMSRQGASACLLRVPSYLAHQARDLIWLWLGADYVDQLLR